MSHAALGRMQTDWVSSQKVFLCDVAQTMLNGFSKHLAIEVFNRLLKCLARLQISVFKSGPINRPFLKLYLRYVESCFNDRRSNKTDPYLE